MNRVKFLSTDKFNILFLKMEYHVEKVAYEKNIIP